MQQGGSADIPLRQAGLGGIAAGQSADALPARRRLFLRGISRAGAAKCWSALAASVLPLLAVAPIGPAMLLALEQRFPRPAVLPEKIDGILVLGGAVDPAISRSYGETVFNSSVSRVLGGDCACPAASRGEAGAGRRRGRVSLRSGSPKRARLEALSLEEGIAPSRVILEERSRSTHENAVFAKEVIRPASRRDLGSRHLGLSHAARRRIFRRRGLAGHPLSGRLQGRSAERACGANFSLLDGLGATTLAGKEWAGLVGYRLLGWTRELFPAPDALPASRSAAKTRSAR